MTVVHNSKPSALRAAGKPDHFSGDGVCLHARSHCGAIVMAATGELDASNFHHLTDYAHRWLSAGRPLVVDLSQLDFLGAQGIRCLFGIAEECERNGIDWSLVPGKAVTRLLRICDKEGRLPAISSVDEAVQGFSALPAVRGLLQLVPKSR
jgi:anti-anti-sigma factor